MNAIPRQPDAAEQAAISAEVATPAVNVRARQLFRSGIGLFVGLGLVTAAWIGITGRLAETYVFIMIPTSAIAVICIFGGFISLVRGDIAAQSLVNSLILGEMRGVMLRQDKTEAEVQTLKAEVATLKAGFQTLQETLAVVTSDNVFELETHRALQDIEQRLNDGRD
jgi:translation initiation factor 6 (eIF-6)